MSCLNFFIGYFVGLTIILMIEYAFSKKQIIKTEFTIKSNEPNKLYISKYNDLKVKNNLYEYYIYTKNPQELKEKLENDTNLDYNYYKTYFYDSFQLKFKDDLNIFIKVFYKDKNNYILIKFIENKLNINEKI